MEDKVTLISEDTIKLIIEIMHNRGYSNNEIAKTVANILNVNQILALADELGIIEEDDEINQI